MHKKNGRQNLSVKLESIGSDEQVLKEVKSSLKLNNIPRTVECFDISNISGSHTVGAMIVWKENAKSRSDYRKFAIKTVSGANDYAAMEEVLSRRYRKLLEQNQQAPDLILIDGGKGQLSSAAKILTKEGVNLDQVDLIGLAKGRSEKRAGIEKGQDDFEYVVKPGRKNIIPLKKNSSTLYFLQNIRDEAHRFAISYYRKKHGKTGLASELESIKGIGKVKRQTLLKHFGSAAPIKKAPLDILKNVKGISNSDAENIYHFFHSRKKPDRRD